MKATTVTKMINDHIKKGEDREALLSIVVLLGYLCKKDTGEYQICQDNETIIIKKTSPINEKSIEVNGQTVILVKRPKDNPYPVWDATLNNKSIGSVSPVAPFQWRIFGNDNRIEDVASMNAAVTALLCRA